MSRQFRSDSGRFLEGHIPTNKGCSLAQSNCEYCDKEFQFNKNNSGGKYCSKKCYVEFRKQPGFRIQNSHRFIKGFTPWNKGSAVRAIKYCRECGTKFTIIPSREETALFCSKQCQGKNEDFRKKVSINQQNISINEWYGFVSQENKLERARFRQTVQKQVLERDDYACQMCGERGGKLQVDHIQPWAEYVGGRFDINNCRTLCMACHYKITFGRELPEGVTTWGHNFSQMGGC